MDLFAVLASATNMVTQIIYLGRMEVGDWYFFCKYLFDGFYSGLDLDILT